MKTPHALRITKPVDDMSPTEKETLRRAYATAPQFMLDALLDLLVGKAVLTRAEADALYDSGPKSL
jgi:hypothetical protein